MAYTLIQSGSTLQLVNSDGVAVVLTLPTGVSLSISRPPRFVVYGNYVIVVNTPDRPLTVNAAGTVRPLTPKPPTVAPVLAAGSAGGLSGTYGGVRATFIIKDEAGELIAESDFSPASNTVSITNQNLAVSQIPTSSETISARRLYRPTTGGTTLFPWLDVDGNTVTAVQDDLADAGLSLIAAPILGTPPRLTLIKEWRNLLWGVGDQDIDKLVFTLPDAFWSWPVTNNIPVPGAGRDKWGVRALMPRREALGVGRRDIIWQVTGNTVDDFSIVKLSENTGIESNESMVVYRDTVFWLWKDGVYQWDGDGINNISDKSVSSWFNSNSYFNRDKFLDAFAVMDTTRLKYRLYLASAGSDVIDRWVEYDLTSKTWWGPHKTSALDPTCAFLLSDDADTVQPVNGSKSGFIWLEQDLATDDTLPIDFEVDSRFFDAKTPDYEKHWGELTVLGKAQGAGVMQITPTVGYSNSLPKSTMVYDMTKGRERLGRLGNGKLMQLNFKHSIVGEPVELWGFQVPYHIIGRR